MPRPSLLAPAFLSVLSVLSIGACRDSGETRSPDPSGSSTASAAPAGKPAAKGSYADLAGRFEQAAAQPNGAGKPELEALTPQLLDAASKRLSELSIVHEVERGDKAAALWISAESGSPLGRVSEALRAGGDTRTVYDLAYFRDRPGRPAGYDPQANVLRLEHAVIQRGGDPDEPRLRHEQARAEVWGLLRRGEPSPYHFRLVLGLDEAVRGDEVYARARDLVRELQGVQDLLISPDDAPITQADLGAVVAAREGGPAIARPLTELELRWDRLADAALRGAADTTRLAPQLKQAQSKAKGKAPAQLSAGPRGASALLQLDPVKDDPAGVGHALVVDLAESTGPEDPKNLAHLRTQLTSSAKAVERHAAHFAAVVAVLRKIAGTPSGRERRELFRALATIIEPVADDAPAKTKTTDAYLKRFDEALQGKTPAK